MFIDRYFLKKVCPLSAYETFQPSQLVVPINTPPVPLGPREVVKAHRIYKNNEEALNHTKFIVTEHQSGELRSYNFDSFR